MHTSNFRRVVLFFATEHQQINIMSQWLDRLERWISPGRYRRRDTNNWGELDLSSQYVGNKPTRRQQMQSGSLKAVYHSFQNIYITSHGLRTLCNGPATVKVLPTDSLGKCYCWRCLCIGAQSIVHFTAQTQPH